MGKTDTVNHDNESNDFDPFDEQLRDGMRFPPFGLIMMTVFVIVAIVVIRAASGSIEDAIPVLDKAFQFVISVGLVLLLLIAFFVWFMFFSGASWLFRLGLLAVVIGSLAAAVMLLEPTQNTGSLFPSGLKWRSAKYADEQLAKLNTEVSATPLSSLAYEIAEDASDTNFSQYFGPNRDGTVDVELKTDWSVSTDAPKQLWRKPIGAGWSGFSAANGFAVTMEQRGEEELTVCYEIKTGEVVWAYAENARHHSPMGGIGPRCTPTIDPLTGNVYVAGATGILVCLDGNNGALLWRKDIFAEVGTDGKEDVQRVMWGRSASPLIVGDKVIISGGGKDKFVSLIAYDKTSGDEIWRGGEDQVSYSSPMITDFHDTPTIVIINEASVTGHDPETGSLLWRHDRPGKSNGDANTAQPVALPNNRLLLTKGYGLGAEVIEIDKTEDGFEVKQIWATNKSLRTKMTSAVVFDDYAYGLNDEVLECVKLKSGKRAWRGGRYGHGQVIRAGETLVVLTEKGEVVLVSATPNGHEELAQLDGIEGITWNIPCLHQFEGKWYLLIRNAEEAACLEMSVKE